MSRFDVSLKLGRVDGIEDGWTGRRGALLGREMSAKEDWLLGILETEG
jgi:hypothetical protein